MPLRERLHAIAGARSLAALVSQGLVAGSSLLLQIVAAWQLGKAGLGQFSLLLAVLVAVNSLQTGWIGDSLTVLDRFDPPTRAALVRYLLIAVVGGAAVCGVIAGFVDGVDDGVAVLFAGGTALWIVEETIRRVLIARREFWKLALNDAIYAIGALGGLVALRVARGTIGLFELVLAICCGAAAAILVGLRQLPAETGERSLRVDAAPAMRSVASFAVWRSAQIALRPIVLAAVRFIVVAWASTAVLGEIEAARLLLAPVLTLAAGAGVYLLPTYSAAVRERRAFAPSVPTAAGALALVSIAYGAVALVAREPLTQLLTNSSFDISPWLIFGWALFAAGFAAGVAVGNAVVALQRSRTAFWLRAVDALLGVVLATVAAWQGWFDAVPAALAAGTFVGAMLLFSALSDPARLPPVAEGRS